MNLSSLEFIKRLRNKDIESFKILIDAYHEALFKSALKQGLALDQAEEVVQQTWSTFFEKAENFEGRSHIRTYLIGILYNKVKELWRSNKKYTQEFDDEHLEKIFNDAGAHLRTPLSPSNWLESVEFMTILEEELQHLPLKQRQVFLLKEVEELETEEICKIMNISVTNLGVLAYRAKHNLRSRIEDRFAEEKK